MLMHEWIKFRNAQVKRAAGRRQDDGGDADDVVQPVEQEAEPAADTEGVTGEAAADEPVAAETTAAQAPAADAENNNREKEALLETLQAELLENGRGIRQRLQALQGRQKQLPMDIDDAQTSPVEEGPRGATETREDLVRRLLDPTLTLREAALLLDVCPATVRRYTNRGLLNCYRTPGNQRRFRLSDILDFMESRERERS